MVLATSVLVVSVGDAGCGRCGAPARPWKRSAPAASRRRSMGLGLARGSSSVVFFAVVAILYLSNGTPFMD
eukprot:7200898-Pyramimonas_sp.AAC.1